MNPVFKVTANEGYLYVFTWDKLFIVDRRSFDILAHGTYGGAPIRIISERMVKSEGDDDNKLGLMKFWIARSGDYTRAGSLQWQEMRHFVSYIQEGDEVKTHHHLDCNSNTSAELT